MRLRTLLLGAALGSPAFAQLPDVAIAAAASGSLGDCRYTDVQAYLQATGQFGNIDIVDCVTTTPALGDLTPYDAVLTWTNVSYNDAAALGDVFADYVDQGGAVVVAVFATSSTTANRSLEGRWQTGYELIQVAGGNVGGAASLGAINNALHPTVQGVSTLEASSAFRPQATIPILQGTVIAEWDDGAPLIVTDAPLGGRVDLGLYPPSNNCSASFFDITTDGDVIVANALTYAISTAGGITGNLGVNYCPATPNSTGNAAEISATGSNTASDNDVTLAASGVPPMQFGIFLTSMTQAATPVASGTLCLGGNIIRFQGPGQILQADMNGEYALGIDISALPAGVPTPIMAGDTYSFTTWFRDVDPMIGNTANFSNGLEIVFN